MIEIESEDTLTRLRLAHGKASALDLEFLNALDHALQDLERSPARAVLLCGRGAIFSAGVDLRRLLEGGRDYLSEFLPALDRALTRLFAFPKPLVAAINGHAIAGGAILALGCERRVLARGKATFGIPELVVGVPFPVSALEIVRHAVAPEHHGELVLSGRIFGPEECLARRLVDELAAPEELESRAAAIALELAAMPPSAYALAKRRLRAPALERIEGESAASRVETLERWCSDEVQASVRAYVERTLRR